MRGLNTAERKSHEACPKDNVARNPFTEESHAHYFAIITPRLKWVGRVSATMER
jgi:hypothetical protein